MNIRKVIKTAHDFSLRGFTVLYVVKLLNGECAMFNDEVIVEFLVNRGSKLLTAILFAKENENMDIKKVIETAHDFIMQGFTALYFLEYPSGEHVTLDNAVVVEKLVNSGLKVAAISFVKENE